MAVNERLTQVTIIRDARSFAEYKPGEIGKPFRPKSSHWFISCPGCGGMENLAEWAVTEHDDETVSISPSVLCYKGDLSTCAHYFIEHNQIRWC